MPGVLLHLLAAWAVACGFWLGTAAATEEADPRDETERVTVRVDGRAVFRVGSTGEEDASARAARIERRIGALRENPQAIAPVVVERSGANGTSRVLSVSGVPVVTITVDDARDNLTDSDTLASQWAAALSRAL